jgi:hypothetical protein
MKPFSWLRYATQLFSAAKRQRQYRSRLRPGSVALASEHLEQRWLLSAVSISTVNGGAESPAPTDGTFSVNLSSPSGSDVIVDYAVTGTATAGSDYSPLSGSVTILAGNTFALIDVGVLDDAVVEGTESVVVTLSNLSSADGTVVLDPIAANLTSSLNITDDDTAKVSVAKLQDGIEGAPGTNGVFTVSISAVSGSATVVNYTVGGNATSGVDYTALSGSVSIPAGNLSANISVPVLNDAIVELNETVTLTLTSLGAHAGGVSLDPNPAKLTDALTIIDDDTATISLIVIKDGAEGTPINGKFRVVQSAISATDTVVQYSVGGSATPGADYTALSGTVTIIAGFTTADIDVLVQNDALVEPIETVIGTLTLLGSHDPDITISNVPTDQTATVNIVDNNSANVSITKVSDGAEGSANGQFMVNLSAISSTNTVVNYSVTGTATSGSDFTALAGSVTIIAGQTSALINVPVINDATVELTETVIATLTSLGSHNFGIVIDPTPANETATVNITDNDSATVSISKILDGAETNSPTSGQFQVALTAVSSTATVVNYTVGGTATSGSDYTALTGSVTIAAGFLTANINVVVLNDSIVESTETVSVTLTSFGAHDADITLNATPANLTSTLNITDNDTALVTIAKISDGAEAATPTNGKFRVTLSSVSSSPTVVNYTVAGTATPGSDYTTLSGSVTVSAGSATADIDVLVLDDLLIESTETVIVTLASLGAHDPDIILSTVPANLTATVNITSDDIGTVSIAKITDGAESNTPTNGKFRVTQTVLSPTDTVVNYTIAGTATPGPGNDYTTLSGTVTILAGQMTADIDVAVLNDAIIEGTETVIATLSGFGAHNASISLNPSPASITATVLITDDDTATVSIAKIADGAEASVPVNGTFRVTQTAVSSSDTVVTYSVGGTASPGGGLDYTLLNGSVTIPAGQTFADITVAVHDDNLVEPTETVILTLTGFTAHDADTTLDASPANLTATMTITDNDSAIVTVSEIQQGVEGVVPTDGTFRIALSSPSSTDTVVNYSIGGTATSGLDYTALTGTVTISAGSSFADIDVPVLNDTLIEPIETVVMTLTGFSAHDPGVTLSPVSTDLTATVNIVDDDTAFVSVAKVTDGAEAAVPVHGQFQISMTGISSTDTIVAYTVQGTATPGNGNDYVLLPGTVTILAGQTTAVIDVPVLDDTIVEPTETVIVNLLGIEGPPSGIKLSVVPANVTATVNIQDNDTATVSIARINDGSEGTPTTTGSFRVTQSAVSSGDTVVNYTIGGTAVGGAVPGAGADYATLSGTVTIPAGQTSADIPVTVFNDLIAEATETVTATLSTLGAHDPGVTIDATPANQTATLSIFDNNTATFTIDDASVSESGGLLTFMVNISQALDVNVTLNVTFTDGTATGGGVDYTGTTQQVTFLAGQTQKLIQVPIQDDSIVEGSETFNAALSLASSVGGRSVDVSDTATGTILDDDVAAFTLSSSSALENAGVLTINLSTTNALDTDVMIDVTFVDGTAKDGTDYVGTTQQILIPAGQTSAQINVPILDDNVVELDEVFTAHLSTSTVLSGRQLDLSSTGLETILDDDFATVSIAKTNDGSESTNSTPGLFTITQSAPSSTPTVVTYSIAGSATPGNDYTPLTGTATIPTGLTSVVIVVPVLDDQTVEPIETVDVTLTGFGAHNSNITLDSTPANLTASVNITDDDTDLLTISSPTVTESAAGSTMTFTVTSPNAVSGGFDVAFNVDGITATVNSDYTVQTTSPLTFAGTANETHTITVMILNDNIVESAETLSATLGAVTPVKALTAGSVVTGAVGTGTIIDNDSASFTLNDVSANESSGVLTFNLTASNPLDINVAITVNFTDLSATGGADYSNAPQVVTFLAGETSKQISVPLNNDNVVEGTETFQASLSTTTPLGSRAIDLSDKGVGTIIDDDTATVSIAKGSDGVEANVPTNGQFIVTLSAPSSTDTVVNYSATGLAAAGLDYQTLPGTITIPAGQTSATIDVNVLNDNIVEGTESVIVTLSGLGAHDPQITLDPNAAQQTATVNIADTDTTLLSITNETITEGDSGTKTMTFTVTSSNAVQGGFSVAFGVTNLTTSNSDYTVVTNGPLTFTGTANESKTITIQIVGDTIAEGDEQFSVNLGAVTPVAPVLASSILSGASGLGTILDNDQSQLTISSPSVVEGDSGTKAMTFTVTSPRAVQGGFTVDFALTDISTDSNDYTLVTSSPLTFSGTAGETQTITVNVIGDIVVEGTEQLQIKLGSVVPNGAAPPASIISGAIGTGTIIDNDAAIFTIDDVTGSESDGMLVFTIVTTKPLNVDTTINVSFTDQTAVSGADYTGVTQQVTFMAGDTSKQISVPIINDNLVEAAETFLASLSVASPVGNRTVVVSDQGIGTILDDDTAVFTISDAAATEGTSAMTFNLVTNKALDQDVTIAVTFTNGSAIGSGVDFTSTTQLIQFPAGTTSKTVTVPINDDSVVEGTETFVASLSTATPLGGRTVDLSDTGTGTITDNDSATISIARIADANESPASPPGKFRVTQTNVSSTDTVVTYTVTGTATPGAGQDYATLSGTVTIPAGQTSADITVATINDALIENTETVVVTLTGFTSHDPQINLNATPANLTATVSILDNDAPLLTNVQSTTVVENTPANTVIIDANSNPAAAPGHTLTFSLSGPDAGQFNIDAVTGEVTFRSSPDFDLPTDQNGDNVYQLTVSVTADVTPAQSTSQNVTVTVTGLNDNSPIFANASPTLVIPENLADGSNVGLVNATDADLPVQTLTYSITSGNEAGAFAIDPATGQITVADSTLLNFEVTPTFEFTVHVTDNGNPANTADAAVVVNLTNVFEGPTVTISSDPPTFQPGSVAVNAAPDATLTFDDAVNPSFVGSTLIISIGSGRNAKDVLSVFKNGDPTGQITTKGHKVFANGVQIGTISGGRGSHPALFVKLNEHATIDSVQSLMNRVSFSSRSTLPSIRVIQVQVINVAGFDSNIATRELSNN